MVSDTAQAMSQESVEIVRQGFAAFERGDVSGMLDGFADDLVTYRAHPDRAIYRGKEGFLAATADWTEGFSEWSAIAEEFTDAGEQVLVRVRQIARGESSGVPVEGEWWFLFEIAAGKVSKLSFYPSRDEAIEAAGLGE